VANTGTLLHDLEAGRLDLVVGGRCTGERRGHTLWREPLVWMYAKGASFVKNSAVPLALFPDPCPYRDAALALLAGAGQKWRIAVVSPSVAGLRAAALSGFAITPLNRSLLAPQLAVLGKRSGMPRLPEVEFVIFEAKQKRSAEATVVMDEIVRAANTFRKSMRRSV
jgi:DNA-binding transcriptional LysR family regulator